MGEVKQNVKKVLLGRQSRICNWIRMAFEFLGSGSAWIRIAFGSLDPDPHGSEFLLSDFFSS